MAAIQAHVGDRFHGAVGSGGPGRGAQGPGGGKVELDGVDAKTFFAMLLQNTREGYFSDPIYGGNKDMASWQMIGFPGAHYDYSDWAGRVGPLFRSSLVALARFIPDNA